MPHYRYTAKDGPDRIVSGSVRAESRQDAVAKVDAMGYSPVSVAEAAEDGGPARDTAAAGRRPSRSSVTLFTRQLASLLRSGVPILRALRTISEQSEDARMKAVVLALESSVRDGRSISDAMSEHGRSFSDFYVNMVRTGEGGGVLDVVLSRLADAREAEDDLRRHVQSALAYPLLVAAAGCVTVFVLLAFFLPRMAELFSSYRQLPFATRALIAVSGAVSRWWPVVLLLAVFVFAVLRRLASVDRGRMVMDRLKLRVPFFGHVIRDSDVARFARTLALLLDSGVKVDKAMDLCAGTVRNAVLEAGVRGARDATVRRGLPFSDGIRGAEGFPLFVANMAAVGEEGGRLDEALLEVASYYEKRVAQQTRIAASLIEPAMILAVGAVVGFIVAAMLLPVFEIGTTLK